MAAYAQPGSSSPGRGLACQVMPVQVIILVVQVFGRSWQHMPSLEAWALEEDWLAR